MAIFENASQAIGCRHEDYPGHRNSHRCYFLIHNIIRIFIGFFHQNKSNIVQKMHLACLFAHFALSCYPLTESGIQFPISRNKSGIVIFFVCHEVLVHFHPTDVLHARPTKANRFEEKNLFRREFALLVRYPLPGNPVPEFGSWHLEGHVDGVVFGMCSTRRSKLCSHSSCSRRFRGVKGSPHRSEIRSGVSSDDTTMALLLLLLLLLMLLALTLMLLPLALNWTWNWKKTSMPLIRVHLRLRVLSETEQSLSMSLSMSTSLAMSTWMWILRCCSCC